MAIWFEGENEILCSLDDVKQAVGDVGAYFTGVVSLMPGLTAVELVEQHDDTLAIRTNEGLMKRTNISTRSEADRVVIEFDEEYEAGSKIATNSHFRHQFVADETGVTHLMVIRDVTAPGLLGFFYRKFGSTKMGNAFLAAHQAHLENACT